MSALRSQQHTPDWIDQATAIWEAGGDLPQELVMAARLRGAPTTPFRGDPVAVARNLAGAGFTLKQLERIFDIEVGVYELLTHRDLEIAVDRVPPELPATLTYHAAAYTVQEIAFELGVTRPWVYYHLAKRNLTPHTKKAPELTTRQRKQITDAYRSGEAMLSIARRFRLPYHQVRYAVRLYEEALVSV